MIRHSTTCRPNWVKTVEDQGLIYHHTKDRPYWNESVYYEFNGQQIDALENATNELQRICLIAGQYIIDSERFKDFGIPKHVWPFIKETWKSEPPAIYGRMDLAYDGKSEPKLLEYNADTPTALIEASVIQWYWLQDTNPNADQFNSIHEKLVRKWKELLDYSPNPLYVTHVDDPAGEDTMTANYIRETAQQAGWETHGILIGDIGWDKTNKNFVGINNEKMETIFKLYPWEWMVNEPFGQHALDTLNKVNWLEPVWKMILSNKAILPVLWELFPNHKNLLPAYFDGPNGMAEWVKKPKLSREGSNVVMSTGEYTDGVYGEEGFIWQQRGPVPNINNHYPVIGSWVIDQESAGIGIRESDGPITTNQSQFVPHLFK